MTYPYGGPPDGGYESRYPSGGVPAQPYPASGSFAAQPYQGLGLGAPQPQPQPPQQPPAKKNGTVLALSVALIVFLGVAGTFTALYFVESGHHNQTTTQLQSREKDLADANNARRDAQDKLKAAEQARDTAQGQVTELTKCRDAARTLIDAAGANKASLSAEIDAMFRQCGR
jgi:uncharacterized protein HemX